MLQNNKDVPDSLLNSFAAMDDYRYTLYSDMEENDLLNLFPKKYHNQADLARSKLLFSKQYNKPDTVAYLDKLPTEVNAKPGYVYFFKYKGKKDDAMWKLATVGLLSKDPKQFEIKGTPAWRENIYDDEADDYDFTSFTDSRLSEDEPVSVQLNRELKRLVYSKRNSAKEFYNNPKSDDAYALKYKN
jgi:hypothetical protein